MFDSIFTYLEKTGPLNDNDRHTISSEEGFLDPIGVIEMFNVQCSIFNAQRTLTPGTTVDLNIVS